MAIITISRGTFAGGQKLAETLAKRLGYRTVSREYLYQTVLEQYGLQYDELMQFLEEAPTLRAMCAGERQDRASVGERRRQLFTAVRASLCELVKDDNVVYHGYAGHLLLPGVSHVVRVRLIAPRPKRIEMAMARETLSRADASRKIDQVDGERARWTQAFFGVNWGDPLLFDIVINLENVGIDEATELLEAIAKLPRFRATEESLASMRELAARSKAEARQVTAARAVE
jgi:cytidylate kinase